MAAQFILPAIGIGLQALGAIGASREKGKANQLNRDDFEFRKGQAGIENERRNAASRLLMPNIMRDMNIRDPVKIGAGGATNTLGGRPGGIGAPEGPGSSGFINAARRSAPADTKTPRSRGLMTAGFPLGGPLGSLGMNKIGQGRRTANILTDKGSGYTTNFDADFKQVHDQIVQLDQSGQATAEDFREGIAQLKKIEADYLAYLDKFALQGGNHKKVADQARNTLNSWIEDNYRNFAQRQSELQSAGISRSVVA